MTTSSALESIFFEALGKQSGAERDAFLNEACADDSELRGQLDRMLAAQARVGTFLEKPAVAGTANLNDPLTISEAVGAVVGPYKLLQQIGEGGMGVVFMARQSQPIQRTVALKIIKPGMDTRQVIARFEAERQALALMDHPNIAKVLDAGATETGRPYFVMELVKGTPITRYCDERRMSLRARLELLLPVCNAIQHAHQKGIIHRDLKPTNVLVAEHDDRAVPTVIDFGVAKASAQRLTERTMFTELGQVVGTMEYMSPEQAKLNQLDVDTRSDIYSLGVMLYELLTGSTPFGSNRLKGAAFDEMLRIIREEEPPKPSTRLSTAEALPSISANRGVEPVKLNRLVRGELDWVVMKALEKDRNRRYATVGAFSADILHYLSDEPVEARAASRAHRARKFVRRNKAGVLAGSSVVAALVVGATAASVGFVRARAEAERSVQVAQVLKDTLAAAGPSVARGRDATLLREILDKTSKRIDSDLKGNPDVQGDVWMTLGNTYQDINDFPRAIVAYRGAAESYRRAFGEQNERRALALAHLGRCQSYDKDIGAGKINTKIGLDMARSCGNGEVLAECLLDRARAFDMLDIGTAEGTPYAREAVELRKRLGGDPVALADCMAVQASVDFGMDAIATYRQVLALHRARLGSDHPKVADDILRLGQRLRCCGKFAEAEPVFREAFDLYRKVYSKDQPLQPLLVREYAETLVRVGKPDEAAALIERAAEAEPNKADYKYLRGALMAAQGKWREAADQFYKLGYPLHWAVAALKDGRDAEYRTLRHEYLHDVGKLFDVEGRYNITIAALLLPLEGADLKAAYDLANVDPATVPVVRYHCMLAMAKALAEYRSGNADAAVDQSARAIAGKDTLLKARQAQAWFIRALACARAGKAAEAGTAFDSGDAMANVPDRDRLDDFLYHWADWVIADLLRNEAAGVLNRPRP